MTCKKIEEHKFQILKIPHYSEKTSFAIEKYNTIVFKVLKNASKKEIKSSVHKLLGIKVHSVNTLIVKNRRRTRKQNTKKCIIWKKAYILIKQGENLDFMNKIDSVKNSETC